MTRYLCICLGLVCAVAAQVFADADSIITEFSDKISIQFLTRYNYANFSGSSTDDEILRTNRPINLGLGGGYGDFTWSSIFTFAFGANEKYPKTKATDVQLSYFGDRFFGDVFFTMNDGFYAKMSDSSRVRRYDMTVMSAGIKANYQWNKNHSLRSVYSMDRRQWKSNGSFILGFGFYYHGIYSEDSNLVIYQHLQNFWHLGPSVGYSYNWIWRSGMFVNLMMVGSASLGKNTMRGEWMYFSQVFPKAAVGYHGDTWSVNFPVYLNVLNLNERDGEINDIFFEASAGFMVTKRF